MLALLKYIVGFFKKEAIFLHKYEKDHPHFAFLLALDAILTVAIVVVGFARFQPFDPNKRNDYGIEDVGGRAMTVAELKEHVHKSGEIDYWLGPISGARYTSIMLRKDISTLTYLDLGKKELMVADKPRLVIVTYAGEKAYGSQPHALLDANVVNMNDVYGNVVSYNSANLQFVTILLKKSHRIIEIMYPQDHTELSMINDAQELTLVR